MQVITCTANLTSNGVFLNNCTIEQIFTDLKTFFTDPIPLGLILGLALFATGLVLLMMASIYVCTHRSMQDSRRNTMCNPVYQTSTEIIPSNASKVEHNDGSLSFENPVINIAENYQESTNILTLESNVDSQNHHEQEIDVDYENVGEKRNM